METVDLSGSLGLVATIFLTLNVLLGMLLSTAYKTHQWWQKLPNKVKKANINDLHNYTAYAALLVVLAHIVIIPLDPSSKFSFIHLLWPIHAPSEPWIVVLGALSFWALVLVIITTQKVVKAKMRFRTWKNIHLVSYLTCFLFIAHGLLMDPELKDRPVDWLDGEKLISEFCGLVLLIALVYRLKHQLALPKKK